MPDTDTTDCIGCGRTELPVRPGLVTPIPVAHVDTRFGAPCSSGPYVGTTTGAAMRGLAADWLRGVEVGPSAPVHWDLPSTEELAIAADRLEECGHCHTLTGSGIAHLYVCPGPVR